LAGGNGIFFNVGRTYHFECPYCHYRVKVSGGADSGVHCEVQAVVCRDCRELLDVFIKVRRCEGAAEKIKFPAFFRPEIPPVILRDGSASRRLVWHQLQPACPVEAKHFWRRGKTRVAARVVVTSWRKTGCQPKFGIKSSFIVYSVCKKLALCPVE